jgi:hypothetical protein
VIDWVSISMFLASMLVLLMGVRPDGARTG